MQDLHELLLLDGVDVNSIEMSSLTGVGASSIERNCDFSLGVYKVREREIVGDSTVTTNKCGILKRVH